MPEAVANEGRPRVLRHREDLGLGSKGWPWSLCKSFPVCIYIYIYIDIYIYTYYILYIICINKYIYIYTYISMYIIHILDSRWNCHIHQPTGFLGTIRVRHIRILCGEKSKLSRLPIFLVVTYSSPILQLPNLDQDPNVCNCWMSSSCFESIFRMGKETKSWFPLVPFTDKLLNFTRGCGTWRFIRHTGLKAGLPRNWQTPPWQKPCTGPSAKCLTSPEGMRFNLRFIKWFWRKNI